MPVSETQSTQFQTEPVPLGRINQIEYSLKSLVSISDHHKTVLILFNSGFAEVKHCIVCKMWSYIAEQSRYGVLAYQKSRQEWILPETTTPSHPILVWFPLAVCNIRHFSCCHFILLFLFDLAVISIAEWS